jgi:hypothetical protein
MINLMLEIISWYILELNSVIQKWTKNYKRVMLNHSKCYKWFNQIILLLTCHQTLILALLLT